MPLFYALLFFLISTHLFAQDTLIHKKQYPKFEQYIQKLQRQNYISAQIDTVIIKQDSLYIRYYIGSQAVFRITIDTNYKIPDFIVDTASVSAKTYTHSQLQNLIKSMIRKAENYGYPFIKSNITIVGINSQTKNTEVTIMLSVNVGNRIIFDNILQQENTVLRNRIIRSQSRISEKTLYDERKIKNITKNIENLPYLTVLRPLEVEFRQGTATPYLYLKKKKNNKVNALLSFVKNEKEKFSLQGEGVLELSNLFQGGEQLILNYIRLENKQQYFHGEVQAPYLLFGSVGFGANLSMTKRDTLFFNLSTTLSTYYSFNFLGRAGFFYRYDKSNPIEQKLNITTNLYGISLAWNKRNKLQFPEDGYSLYCDMGVGNRIELENNKISQQFMAECKGDLVVPIYSNAYCLLRAEGKANIVLQNSTPLSAAEVNYIGGIYSLRGFNEQSIPAQTYGLLSLEPFWNSGTIKFSVFYDIAYTHFIASQLLHGYGVGIRIFLKSSELSLYLALGSPIYSVPQLNNSKLHIGYNFIF